MPGFGLMNEGPRSARKPSLAARKNLLLSGVLQKRSPGNVGFQGYKPRALMLAVRRCLAKLPEPIREPNIP